MVAYANEMQMDTRSSDRPEQRSGGEEDVAQGILPASECGAGERVFRAMMRCRMESGVPSDGDGPAC